MDSDKERHIRCGTITMKRRSQVRDNDRERRNLLCDYDRDIAGYVAEVSERHSRVCDREREALPGM